MQEDKKKKIIISTIIKYFFSILITIVASVNVKDGFYCLAGVLELLIIFVISNILISNKKIGNIINSILMLFYNIQMGVLIFGNTYISMIMLNNLDSIEALAGKAIIYILAIIIVFMFSFIPIKTLEMSKKKIRWCLLAPVIGFEFVFVMILGLTYSPIYGYINLGIQHYKNVQLENRIQKALEGDISEVSYYNEEVKGYREKETGLPKDPNIILIFTEGLSQNIVEDERNIMPNVAEYQKKSLSFENYYNHTFATYRGLIGQLYSGYQLDNFDTNELISLQSILKDNGYNTTWINSEPLNPEFTEYLKGFDFNQIMIDENFEHDGGLIGVSDQDMYQILFDTAEEQAESEEPFFISMYTFGTHATFDSPDEKYGDGKDAEINKFYNVDYQFGEFMRKFEESFISEDTIVIFTTDHATYKDDSFSKSFAKYKRIFSNLDDIPFFIYYKGMEPEVIDVNGRNSICLTPTILDYLDISATNYFVGTSLFSEKADNICETSFTDAFVRISSENAIIHALKEDELEIYDKMMENYYITKEVIARRNENLK